jgi:hypothetical protein
MKHPKKCHFSLQKNREQEGKRSCLEAGISGRGEEIRKGDNRMNIVEIYCTNT